jgi:phospholipid/cholesterol/gamma-HCH transport system substrate-binding protein
MKKQQRKIAIGLLVFLLVTSTMTWLVYATLERTVTGKTTEYAAEFTDAFGLRGGDDVRMAGVRVGRVSTVELVGEPGNNLARVAFELEDNQRIFPNTEASILYQNIVGQRYLDLRLGPDDGGDTSTPLPSGSVIPVERTIPSFDVGVVLNGYQPLFASIDPEAADQITNAAVQAFQGDTGAMATLVEKTSSLTEAVAGRDELLGDLITGLNRLFSTLAKQNDNLATSLSNAQHVVASFNGRREELISSMGSISRVVRALGTVTTDVNPALQALITREPGATAHLLSIEPQLAFMGANLPKVLKGLANVGGNGSYFNAYICDVNLLGFFPGLNDVIPVIVNAATPGNQAKHTPKCRNMANG